MSPQGTLPKTTSLAGNLSQLLGTFPAISPSPSGPDPALLHAWHPGRAANHRESQILPRHLAQTPHPTSSCALSVSKHPGSSFPRKRILPTAHPAPFPMEDVYGYRDRASLSSGSRQDLVQLDLPAEVGKKRENVPPDICRSSCVTLQDDQGVTGRGRRAAQPCRVPHTQTPSNPNIPSFVSSHVQMVSGSWGKIGQTAQRWSSGNSPRARLSFGSRKEGGRTQLAGSCWGWSCSRTHGQGTGQSQKEHQVTELCVPTSSSSHGVGSDP